MKKVNMKENIKIKLNKNKNNNLSKNYISKDEFLLINDNNNILKYIRLMKKMKYINKELFIKNIYNILFEISIQNTDISNMKIFVNNYYKHVKVYKKHMLSLSKTKEHNKYIIDFYVNLFEKNKNMDINSIRYIFHLLYNEKILYDKYILEWYHNLEKNSIFLSSSILKDFMEWLEDQASSDNEVSDNSEVDSD